MFSKDGYEGLIQSPNYPGEYPTNVSCVWKIRPAKDRRILVIIPEVFLPKGDKCGDKLVMRKSSGLFTFTLAVPLLLKLFFDVEKLLNCYDWVSACKNMVDALH